MVIDGALRQHIRTNAASLVQGAGNPGWISRPFPRGASLPRNDRIPLG